MHPDLEYWGGHQESNLVLAWGLMMHLELVEALQNELGIDQGHLDFWEWTEEDWMTRVMEGVSLLGSDYEKHRASVRERHEIELSERG